MFDVFVALVCAGCQPPYCAVRMNFDTVAKTGMAQVQQKLPYENAFSMFCNATQSTPVYSSHFRTSWETGNDPCQTTIYVPAGMVNGTYFYGAGAHTHPWFNTSAEYLAGDGCRNATAPVTQSQLNTLNTSTNANFGAGDRTFVSTTRKPLYMRIPAGTQYKVRFIRNVDGITVEVVIP